MYSIIQLLINNRHLVITIGDVDRIKTRQKRKNEQVNQKIIHLFLWQL